MAVSFPDLGKCKPKGPSYGVWYGFQIPYGSPPNRPIYGVRIKQMASGVSATTNDDSDGFFACSEFGYPSTRGGLLCPLVGQELVMCNEKLT